MGKAGTADCSGKWVWEHIRVGVAEGMFDKEEMISGISHKAGHCTYR